jgi:hypothetical protein
VNSDRNSRWPPLCAWLLGVCLTIPGVAGATLLDLTLRIEEAGTLEIGAGPGLDLAPDIFTIVNDSSPGVTVDFFTVTLLTALALDGDIFFDTVPGGDGVPLPFLFRPLASEGGDAVVGFPGCPAAQGSLDGRSTLLLPFSDFDAGESFVFTGDLDDDSARVGNFDLLITLVGAQFGGAGDGTWAFGVINNLRGEVRILRRIPAPAPLALAVAGVGLLLVRRRG